MNLKKLSAMAKRQPFQEDQVIFHEGDLGDSLYIILSGKVGIARCAMDPVPDFLATLEPGSFFGEMSLLEDEPRSASAIGQEAGILLSIDKEAFGKVMAEEPELAMKIMKTLSRRLRNQNEENGQLKAALRQRPAEEGTWDTGDTMDTGDTGGTGDTGPEDPSLWKEDYQETIPAQAVIQGNPPLVVDFLQEESIFPPGHTFYHQEAPPAHQANLLPQQVTCPACQQQVAVNNQRFSRLRLVRVEEDFRHVFQNHEPLWYNVWVCCNCFYAHFHNRFAQPLFSFHRDRVLANTLDLKAQVPFCYTEPRQLDQVFVAYYLALQTLLSGKPDFPMLAKLWMNLTWLYRDAKDPAMEDLACRQAFHYVYRAYYESATLSQNQEQKLVYLMAGYYERYGNPKEARQYYHKAIVRTGGDSGLTEKAYDHVARLKPERKEENL